MSDVSACWLTGLGIGTPSRYLARTISCNACRLSLSLMQLASQPKQVDVDQASRRVQVIEAGEMAKHIK